MTERFLIDSRWVTLVAIGFFGSYTTFSSYTYESLKLIVGGQQTLGLFNLLGSSVLGGLAAAFGLIAGRWI